VRFQCDKVRHNIYALIYNPKSDGKDPASNNRIDQTVEELVAKIDAPPSSVTRFLVLQMRYLLPKSPISSPSRALLFENMPIPDGAKMTDCPVYNVGKCISRSFEIEDYLESDNSIKCVSKGKISRNMFDNMFPPSRGLESMQNNDCAKIYNNWGKYCWFCSRGLR